MNQRYEIRQRIGQGGLGSVFKAYDNQLHREVAIKRVLTTGQGSAEEISAAGSKLIAEAQTLSSLSHPNIVTVFDVGQDEAGGFVVMELLKGETLDDTVERGVLTVEDFQEVVFQTMEGLIAAQAKNVIHRDIKPTNIMLIWQASGRFQLKILDFGLAKFSKTPSVQTMDQEDAVMGSIFFMAPEQFERGELDARTDLYQMGCVYYYALTGQYAFNGETAPQVMNAHLQHKVLPLDQLRPDLPPALSQWVMWLINRDIGSRPANAKEALKYFPKDAQNAPALPVAQAAPAKPATGPHAAPALKAVGGAVPTRTPGAATTSLLRSGANAAAAKPGAAAPSKPGAAAPSKPGAAAAAPTKPGGPLKKGPEAKTDSSGTGKKGISGATITSIAAVAVMAVAGLFVYFKMSAAKAREARMESLRIEAAPVGTDKDVAMLIGYMDDKASTPQQKRDAYDTLKKLKGEGIDAAILDRIEKIGPGSTRNNLATVISARGYAPAFPVLMKMSNLKDEKIREQYLRSARPLATEKHVDLIINGLKEAGKFSRLYEDMLVNVVKQSANAESALNTLRERVRTAAAEEQRSLFRVLGILNGAKTAALLDQIFAGSDTGLQKAALIAYTSWPDRSPLKAVAGLAASSNAEIASLAQSAYRVVAAKPGPVLIGQRIEDWKAGYELLAKNPVEQMKLVQSASSMPHPRTVSMLESWKESLALGKMVAALIGSMNQKIQSLPVMETGVPLEAKGARIEGIDAGQSPFLGIVGWSSPETYFTWHFKVKEAGEYKISVNQADLSPKSSEFVIYLAGQTFKGQSSVTPTLEEFSEVALPGTVTLAAGEIYDLSLVAGEKTQPKMMDIGSIVLTKVN